MKIKAVTFSFADAPAGSVSVKVTRRLYSNGVFGSSTNQQVTLVSGAADVTFTGLDGQYSFFSSWVDGSGVATPIGTCVIPANL